VTAKELLVVNEVEQQLLYPPWKDTATSTSKYRINRRADIFV